MTENLTIDLNADAGESFGRWQVADEPSLFPHLTSVNLACGFHAGDPLSMQAAVELAKANHVAVGAHPGFPDKVGFGRRDLAASAVEVESDVLYQLGALQAFLNRAEMTMHHVKAHGSLYLKMMVDTVTARAVAEAVAAFDVRLPLVVLAGEGGELMKKTAEGIGLRTVSEAFPDRAYLANGQLAPRHLEGSVLNDAAHIAERAVGLATGQALAALDGGEVSVQADTLCLHGDNPSAPKTAAAVRHALKEAGVSVAAF
ncbi:MAG: LamB/YcsF family protein [Deinococcota bacterium]|nr:LamB/YcsF family protein [Deinococcota bacterium]